MHNSLCRLLIVDDHPLFREGIIALLTRYDDVEVVGVAGSAATAREMFTRFKPDVTLMDLRLPDESGASVILALHRLAPSSGFIVLTTYDGDEDIYRALQAGARAYLLKDMSSTELIDTIRRVHRGEHFIAPAAAARLAERLKRPPLNEQETTILSLLVRGLSNKEISVELKMPEDTVKWHLKNVFVKLGVVDRTQAAITAVQRGIVHLGQ
jgi:DNA-binding NarL/FixJ family response regulator